MLLHQTTLTVILGHSTVSYVLRSLQLITFLGIDVDFVLPSEGLNAS